MIEKSIVIGTGKLPYLCAKELLAQKIDCIVYEYGAYEYSLLKEQCIANEIEYESLKKEQLIERLEAVEKNTLIVSANNTFIFPTRLVKKENFYIINFHPALLPKHPGRNAEAWAIYEEENKTGITWHVVNEKIDSGKILVQGEIRLDNKMTSLKLMVLQINLAFHSFKEVLPMLLVMPREKTEDTISYPDERHKIHLSKDIPNEGILNIKWNIEKISAFLRAMDYGKLKVLGTPKCKIENEIYIWDNYVIHKNDCNRAENISMGVFANEDIFIQLMGFRRADNERADISNNERNCTF